MYNITTNITTLISYICTASIASVLSSEGTCFTPLSPLLCNSMHYILHCVLYRRRWPLAHLYTSLQMALCNPESTRIIIFCWALWPSGCFFFISLLLAVVERVAVLSKRGRWQYQGLYFATLLMFERRICSLCLSMCMTVCQSYFCRVVNALPSPYGYLGSTRLSRIATKPALKINSKLILISE